ADARAEPAGPREEEVAGEDGDVVAPQCVGAVRPPTGGRGVHHVVVVEAGEVGELDQHRRVLDPGRIDVTEGCGQQDEHRAHALAAGVHEVPACPAHHVVRAGHGFTQT